MSRKVEKILYSKPRKSQAFALLAKSLLGSLKACSQRERNIMELNRKLEEAKAPRATYKKKEALVA